MFVRYIVRYIREVYIGGLYSLGYIRELHSRVTFAHCIRFNALYSCVVSYIRSAIFDNIRPYSSILSYTELYAVYMLSM